MSNPRDDRKSNRSPLWRLDLDEEVREELEHHLELRTRELEETGLSRSEAEQSALERFGDLEIHRRDCESEGRSRNQKWRIQEWFDELRLDLRFSRRQIRRNPGFSFVLLTLLAVGIGMTATAFSVLDEALLAPLPFDEPRSLISVWESRPARGNAHNVVSPANFMAWLDHDLPFEQISAFITFDTTLTGGERAFTIATRGVTTGYFQLLGREPVIGRLPTAVDYSPDAEAVALISHQFWQQNFGSDRGVTDESITLDGEPHQIIGVMPADFELDLGPSRRPYGDPADLWIPMPYYPQWREPLGRWMMVIGRLKVSETLTSANVKLKTIHRNLGEQFVDFNAGWTTEIIPLHQQVTGDARVPTLALFGSAFLTLVIICINGGGLLIGRAIGRRNELAIRSALGAGRNRIIRQLAVEGSLIAIVAGLGGLLLAFASTQLIAHSLPAQFGVSELTLDSRGLTFGFLVVTLSAVFFGLLPALLSDSSPARVLRGGRTSSDRRSFAARSALVFAELALAAILVIGCGLMTRTLQNLLAVDLGFDRGNQVSFIVSAPEDAEQTRVDHFFDQLLERLTHLDAVDSAGAVSHLPIASVGAATSFWPTDREEPEPGQAKVADIRLIRGDYLTTLGIDLLEGRSFDRREQSDSEPRVVLVNQLLAERYWPSQSPIGKTLRINWGEAGERQIVGVVANVHHAGLDTAPRDAIYFPHVQEPSGRLTIVIKTSSDPDLVVAAGRSIIADLEPNVPIDEIQTLAGIVDESLASKRFLTGALGVLAAGALFLAALGLYGILAITVVQRTPEIGVRMALGAKPSEIALQFLFRTGRLVVAALATGTLAAAVLARVAESMLFEVSAYDPTTLGIAAVVLLVAALAAITAPVLKAARTEITTAIRWE